MLTLGVESSCDETAAAVVSDGGEILSNVVHSQIPVHARYGGVVPELASRNHVMAILPVISQALSDAGTGFDGLDLIAVTNGPGLVGSLLVGVETAKMLAFIHDIPFVGVHHIEGHLLSPFVDPVCRDRLAFPYVGLIVSGGHTNLFLARGVGDYELLGRTLDDAAGEAFDKVAKRLGGPYPGGPWVQRTAEGGDPAAYRLPRPMLGRGLDFSFSGLKTAVVNLVASLETSDPSGPWLPDLCASVQEAVVDVLLRKALKAVQQQGCRHLVIAGGVACNARLREVALARAADHDVTVVVPRPPLCTDNAAMIAYTGGARFLKAPVAGFCNPHLDVSASLPIGIA